MSLWLDRKYDIVTPSPFFLCPSDRFSRNCSIKVKFTGLSAEDRETSLELPITRDKVFREPFCALSKWGLSRWFGRGWQSYRFRSGFQRVSLFGYKLLGSSFRKDSSGFYSFLRNFFGYHGPTGFRVYVNWKRNSLNEILFPCKCT